MVNNSSKGFPIVGIGASAGGLEALTELVKNLPGDTGMAFIIAQHLDPQAKSILTELLTRVAQMPVKATKDGDIVEPNTIYVMPSHTAVTLAKGRLKLAGLDDHSVLLTVITRFFDSLAEDAGMRAIGVLLSGTGSDGVYGLRAIKAAGGITFAQDPATAAYTGMPAAAIAAGVVDFILPPGLMGKELSRIGRHPYVASQEIDGKSPETEAAQLKKIFTMLADATGVDFTHYKQNTIRRRIARRMALFKLEKIAQYLKYLQQTPNELDSLYHDMLITVSDFFRDVETFEQLKETILPALMKGRQPDAPIRVWVPACSTGEEAYTIAILLAEFLEKTPNRPPVQIFGTDINERAISEARQGLYPESIAGRLSAERLRRFFVPVHGGFQITKSIRDICVFAKHDLIKDPPFVRLDLISCRNLLIYLEPVLQQKVIRIFHYALQPAGWLVLGASESIGQQTDLFELVDKKHKLYARRGAPARLPFELTAARYVPEPIEQMRIPPSEQPIIPPFDVEKEADRLALEKYAPAGFLINDAMEIVQFRGETAPYLQPHPGKATLNLMSLATEGLAAELSIALHEARKTNKPTDRHGLRIKRNGDEHKVNLEVLPIKGPSNQFHYLVFFESAAAPATEAKAAKLPEPAKSQADDLKRELDATREYLQSVMREKDAGTEAVRTANEQLQSSYEELQTINEELQTAMEELQATNEELSTVNDELQKRNFELAEATDDLANLLNSVDIPIVMLAGDLSVRAFTPAAEKVLNVRRIDIGRPINDIKLKIDIPQLDQWISEVISTEGIHQQEIQDAHGRWYDLRIRPYLTGELRVQGSVISLIDIDAVKRGLEKERAARAELDAIFNAMIDAVIVLDSEGILTRANPAAAAIYGVSPVGVDRAMLVRHLNCRHPGGRQLVPDALPISRALRGETITGERMVLTSGHGRDMTVLVSAAPLYSDGRLFGAVTIWHDISEIERLLERLDMERKRLEALIDNSSAFIYIKDIDGRYILVNRRFEQLFKIAKEEIQGKTDEDLFPKGIADERRAHDLEVLKAKGPIEFDESIPSNGRPRSYISIKFPLLDAKGEPYAVCGMSTDITERRQAQRLSDALNEINAAIASTFDMDEMMERVFDETFKAIEVESAALCLRAGDRWVVEKVHNLPADRIGVSFTDKEMPNALWATQAKRPVAVDDAGSDPRVNPRVLKKYGVRSVLTVPFTCQKETVGVIFLNYESAPVPFTEAQIDFAGKLAASMSLAIVNARLHATTERELARTKMFEDVAMAATASPDLKQVGDGILAALSKHLKLHSGDIKRYDSESQKLRLVSAFGYPQETIERIKELSLEQTGFLTTEAMRLKRMLTDADDKLTPARQKALKQANLENCRYVIVPLFRDDALVGGFSLTFDGKRDFTRAELDLFQTMAHTIGQALATADFFAAQAAAEKKAEEELEISNLLLKATDTLASPLELPPVLESLADILVATTGRTRVSITLLDERTEQLQVAAVRGRQSLPAGSTFKIPLAKSVLGDVISQKRAAVIDYTRGRMSAADKRSGAAYNIKLVLIAPMVADGNVIGLITVDEPGEVREFSSREKRLLEGIASQAAVVIENARLHEKTAAATRTFQAIAQMGTLIASTLTIEEAVPQIIDYAMLLLDLPAAILLRLDKDAPMMRIAAAEGIGRRPAAMLSYAEAAALGLERPGARPLDFSYLSRAPFFAAIAKRGFTGGILAPIFIEDRLNGYLIGLSKKPLAPSDDDLAAFNLFGSQTAAAMKNAARYETERTIARTLQGALLSVPESIAGVDFSHVYRSATAEEAEAGGDFYDIFELGQDRIGVIIGDVAGKGIKAATLTGLTKNTLSAYAHLKQGPATAMAFTNDALIKKGDVGLVTVFLGTLDVRTGEFLYCNAGHPPPTVKGPGAIRRLAEHGPAIGIMKDYEYAESTAALHGGDALILYTDGVTEARRAGEFYGEGRLEKLIATMKPSAPKKIIAGILNNLMDFTDGAFRDDIALLALRLKRPRG